MLASRIWSVGFQFLSEEICSLHYLERLMTIVLRDEFVILSPIALAKALMENHDNELLKGAGHDTLWSLFDTTLFPDRGEIRGLASSGGL